MIKSYHIVMDKKKKRAFCTSDLGQYEYMKHKYICQKLKNNTNKTLPDETVFSCDRSSTAQDPLMYALPSVFNINKSLYLCKINSDIYET